jgi:hypothetical protein
MQTDKKGSSGPTSFQPKAGKADHAWQGLCEAGQNEVKILGTISILNGVIV